MDTNKHELNDTSLAQSHCATPAKAGVWDGIRELLKYEERNEVMALIMAILVFVVLLIITQKSEAIPTTILGFLAVYFTYKAYQFSREKFRFELFEKRFEIYVATLNFCSILTQKEISPENMAQIYNQADESFTGIGWHKTKALFGDDIHNEFERLNQNFCDLQVYDSTNPIATKARGEITTLAKKLPDMFSPYMYFGDYKR